MGAQEGQNKIYLFQKAYINIAEQHILTSEDYSKFNALKT